MGIQVSPASTMVEMINSCQGGHSGREPRHSPDILIYLSPSAYVNLVVVVWIFDMKFSGIDTNNRPFSIFQYGCLREHSIPILIVCLLTIFLMHLFDFPKVATITYDVMVKLVKPPNGRPLRARNTAQRMKIEVVDTVANKVTK